MTAFEEIAAAYIAEKRAVGYKMERAGGVIVERHFASSAAPRII